VRSPHSCIFWARVSARTTSAGANLHDEPRSLSGPVVPRLPLLQVLLQRARIGAVQAFAVQLRSGTQPVKDFKMSSRTLVFELAPLE
jgi:hypothetical protein